MASADRVILIGNLGRSDGLDADGPASLLSAAREYLLKALEVIRGVVDRRSPNDALEDYFQFVRDAMSTISVANRHPSLGMAVRLQPVSRASACSARPVSRAGYFSSQRPNGRNAP